MGSTLEPLADRYLFEHIILLPVIRLLTSSSLSGAVAFAGIGGTIPGKRLAMRHSGFCWKQSWLKRYRNTKQCPARLLYFELGRPAAVDCDLPGWRSGEKDRRRENDERNSTHCSFLVFDVSGVIFRNDGPACFYVTYKLCCMVLLWHCSRSLTSELAGTTHICEKRVQSKILSFEMICLAQ